jgi:hypothetical protein
MLDDELLSAFNEDALDEMTLAEEIIDELIFDELFIDELFIDELRLEDAIDDLLDALDDAGEPNTFHSQIE